ncbi:MAG: hypothetical protein QM713_00785 [Arachnia sp.]
MTVIGRVRYESTIPYDRPASLDELCGPDSGLVEVGAHIDTSPHPFYDLADADQAWALYTRVVRDGTIAEQRSLLRHDWLIRLWPSLMLPARCRSEWEQAFPILAAERAA